MTRPAAPVRSFPEGTIIVTTLLHAGLRAAMPPDAPRVGPFLVGIDPHDDGIYRNYAVPDDSADPTEDEVAALVATFLAHRRTPRLEYLPSLCPALERRLLAAAFVPERRLPVLACPPEQAAEPLAPPGTTVRLAESEADLREVAGAQNDAYGAGPATGHDVDRLRGVRDGGGLVALAATDDGRGIGGGLVVAPTGGIAELAAIGVRAAHRRRGVARALTALLTRACPSVGVTTPYLTPAGPDEERVYRAVGYRDATEMLHISRRAG